MSATTNHGDNIAEQIQNSDAYGQYDILTVADVWNILDNLHTHFLDTRGANHPLLGMLSKCMEALEAIDEGLPL
jgi:hypothetical protein